MKTLFIDYHPKRTAVGLTEDGRLVEFYYERNSSIRLVGNIYKGKVENTFKGMKAAFVNIGLPKNAFLSFDEALYDNANLSGVHTIPAVQKTVSAGDVVMCQVIKDQFGNKGARVTTNVSIPGRTLVLIPGSEFVGVSRKIEDEATRERLEKLLKEHCPPNTGLIARTAAGKATDDEIVSEISWLLDMWRGIVEDFKLAPPKSLVKSEAGLISRTLRDMISEDLSKIVVSDKRLRAVVRRELNSLCLDIPVELYEGDQYFLSYYNIARQAYAIVNRTVSLENGAYLVFDRTEALTVVDVNTGKYVGETDLEDTVTTTNLLAAKEIARQIRLRNLGGIILVDFIDMREEEHRAAVLAELAESVKSDRIRTTVVGMTNLGLVEITRKKERIMADEVFLTECPYCHGAGKIYMDEMVIMRIREELIYFFNRNKKLSVAILEAHPEVIEKIISMQYFLHDMETEWEGKKLYLVSNPQKHVEKFELYDRDSCPASLMKNARLFNDIIE